MFPSLESVRHQFRVSTDHLPAGFTFSAVEVVDARREVLRLLIDQGIKRFETTVGVNRLEVRAAATRASDAEVYRDFLACS
jgi:hypothetical protein